MDRYAARLSSSRAPAKIHGKKTTAKSQRRPRLATEAAAKRRKQPDGDRCEQGQKSTDQHPGRMLHAAAREDRCGDGGDCGDGQSDHFQAEAASGFELGAADRLGSEAPRRGQRPRAGFHARIFGRDARASARQSTPRPMRWRAPRAR